MTCTKLKKLYNEAILLGKMSLKILARDVTASELEDIKECGFSVIEKGKLLIIKE